MAGLHPSPELHLDHHRLTMPEDDVTQVVEGVVVIMVFDQVTDLPKMLPMVHGDLNVVITIVPEDQNGLPPQHKYVELGRAGPFKAKPQRDPIYCTAPCEKFQVIMPLRSPARLQGRTSRLQMRLWHLNENRNLDPLGITEPFLISAQGGPSSVQYKIAPHDKERTSDFVLTKISLSQKLVRERPQQNVVRSRPDTRVTTENDNSSDVFVLNFDKLEDLPGPPRAQMAEGNVLLIVVPADSQDAHEIGRAGPFPTTEQQGGRLHKVSCHGARVKLHEAHVRVLVWYVVSSSGLDLIGSTKHVDLSGKASALFQETLLDDVGGQVGRLYMSHSRQQADADGRLMRPPGQWGSGLAGPDSISLSSSTLGKWPFDVTEHLESPESMDEHWGARGPSGYDTAQDRHRTLGLMMVAGKWQIKHPEKFHHGPLEKAFISKGGGGAMGGAVGIFELHEPSTRMDDYRMEPTKMMELTAAECQKHCERARLLSAPDRAAHGLQEGCRACRECRAHCAGIVAALNSLPSHTELGVARLGNPVLWQIRKIPGTPETGAHAKVVNHAGQSHMSSTIHPVYDGAEKAELYKFTVQEGDLLVLGSDGLFDNLHYDEVCELMEWTISPMECGQTWYEASQMLRSGGSGVSTNPENIAAALAKAANHRARDKEAVTPLATRTSKEKGGQKYIGGKLDDITVVCAWIARTSL